MSEEKLLIFSHEFPYLWSRNYFCYLLLTMNCVIRYSKIISEENQIIYSRSWRFRSSQVSGGSGLLCLAAGGFVEEKFAQTSKNLGIVEFYDMWEKVNMPQENFMQFSTSHNRKLILILIPNCKFPLSSLVSVLYEFFLWVFPMSSLVFDSCTQENSFMRDFQPKQNGTNERSAKNESFSFNEIAEVEGEQTWVKKKEDGKNFITLRSCHDFHFHVGNLEIKNHANWLQIWFGDFLIKNSFE